MKQENRVVLNELLVDVFNQILSIEQEELKKVGVVLSITEVHVLEVISKVEEATMGNVAKKLRVTLGTLTTSIDRLVKKGFVQRKVDQTDRRKVLIELLEPATEVLTKHEAFHDDLLRNLSLETTVNEDELLIKSLKNLNEYFKIKY